MTRLFIAAGLTSVGVESIHFIDGSHSLFSYAPAAERVGDRGDPARPAGVTGDREAAKGWNARRMPSRGQVGVLRIDGQGYRSQFVVSSDQPLPERLLVSAPSPSPLLSSRWGLGGRRSMHARGEPGECVKFVAGVGSWGQEREKWFPSEDDARALQLALSEFCPISWLLDEAEDVGDVDEDDGGRYAAVGVGTGPGDGLYKGRSSGGIYGRRKVARLQEHYNSQPRKLVIYQRDRNRRLANTDEIALELYERLSNLGWSVTEIMHHPDNHPCDVVNELASADVLLTPYGFQSILAVFMRPDSVLFEVFPHKVAASGYGALAKGLRVRYGSVESRPLRGAFMGNPLISWEACVRWRWCYSYARHSDVELSKDNLELVIELMLHGERMR